MSVQNVQKFYEAIAGDEKLRRKLTGLSRGHRKGEMDEAGIARFIEQKILPMAAQMGFEFSLADLWRHAEEIQQSHPLEDLEEHELEAIIGGSNLCVLTGSNTADQCACYFIGAGSFPGSAKSERGFYACFLAGNLPP